jgi:hypothetical protein
MNPDPEEDLLGENLGRALGACRDQVSRSRSEFLRRAAQAAVPRTRRRPSAGILSVAASLLACAAILAAILSPVKEESRPPVREEPPGTPPDRVMAQEPKPPVPPKPPASDEVGLADQIAFQERLLEKTTDEKERALVLATIRTLRGELARAQKAKPGSQAPPESPQDRLSRLRADLESVREKLKNAKAPEDESRLQAKEKAILQELKQAPPGGETPAKGAPKKPSGKPEPPPPDAPRSAVEREVEWIALHQRLAELMAEESKFPLSDSERSRIQKEKASVQAAIDRLKESASSENKNKK